MDNQPTQVVSDENQFSVQPTHSTYPKEPILFPVILLIIVLVIGSGIGVATGLKLRHSASSNSYQVVIEKFITAIQHKDKTTADALESPAAKTLFQKNNGSASFYDGCQKSGGFCQALFSQSALAKAPKTYKKYTASNGTKGEEVTYLVNPFDNADVTTPGCNSPTITNLTVAVIPTGGSWLIDTIDEQLAASAGVCPGSSSGKNASPTAAPTSTTPSPASPVTSVPASPSSTPAPTPAPPPIITLTNQDNGRTVTVAVGTTVNIAIAQDAGVTGYHWSESATTYDAKIFSATSTPTHGDDGSIGDSFTFVKAGTATLLLVDNPDCYPSCTTEHPSDQWSASIVAQ
jgi:hypothetical protein